MSTSLNDWYKGSNFFSSISASFLSLHKGEFAHAPVQSNEIFGSTVGEIS